MDRRFSFDRRVMLGTVLAIAGAHWLPGEAVAQGAADSRARSAMDACEELSRLEAIEHLPALYTFYSRIHPDAQDIVPRHVVIGWYQDEWQPREPEPAVATGVRFVDWTWPVNGVTYRDIAEVSFRQVFGNAPATADVVRLAEVNGEWRWFFGRDRAWVMQQIDHYNDLAYIDQSGTVPWMLNTVVRANPQVIRSLPLQIDGAMAELASDARSLPDYAAHIPVAVQYRDAEYPVGYAMATTLHHSRDMADTIDAIVWERVQAPPFTLLAWNLDPDNDVPFAIFEHMASDAVGTARTIIWGAADGSILWTISFADEERLRQLARALVAIGSTGRYYRTSSSLSDPT